MKQGFLFEKYTVILLSQGATLYNVDPRYFEALLTTTIEAFQQVRNRKKLPEAVVLESAPQIAKRLNDLQLGINQKRVVDTGDLFMCTVEHMYTTCLANSTSLQQRPSTSTSN